MIEVEVPRMRRDVMDTLAVLADVEYQQRAWIRREGFLPGQYDEFDYHVHVLYDDASVLPRPEDSLQSVLIGADEVERLSSLAAVLDALLDEHGDAKADVFMADPRWPEVSRLAGFALAAMVRNWGFPFPG